MSECKGKIQRVVLEFDNCMKELDGDAAQDWMRRLDSNCTIAGVHNCNAMDGFDFKQFKVTSKVETEKG